MMVKSMQYVGHESGIYHLAFVPRSDLLLSGDYLGNIRLWDVPSGTLVTELHPSQIDRTFVGLGGLAVSPDGQQIAACLGTTPVELVIWDLRDGAEQVRLSVDDCEYLAWSPDGTQLACASGNTLSIRDGRTGLELFSLNGHRDYVTSIAWSPDGKRLASGTPMDDQVIFVWNMEQRSLEAQISTRTNEPHNIESLSFRPDGTLVGSKGYGLLFHWNPATGQQTLLFDPHTSGYGTAFSPDVSLVAYESLHGHRVRGARPLADGTLEPYFGEGYQSIVHVVTVANGQTLVQLSGHIDTITSMSFSEDGQLLATADGAGCLHVWKI